MRLWILVVLLALTLGLAIAPVAGPSSATELLPQVTNCNAVINPTCENPTPRPFSAAETQVPLTTNTATPQPGATATPTLVPGTARVTAVSPNSVNAVAQTPLTVSGQGFTISTTVLVNGQPVQTAFNNAGSLTAFVPPGLASGSYAVSVQNPGQPPSPPLVNAFTVTGLQQGLFVPVIAKGAAGGSTTVHVQNIASVPTTVYVLYYDVNGHTEATWTQTANVLAGASAMFDASANNALPAGFDGSAVVQSAQAITAIVNRVNTSGATQLTTGDVQSATQRGASAGSFPAFASGAATQMTVPVTFGGYRSYRTTISVQNTSSQPASYNVALYPTGVTSPVTTIPRLIPPLASARIRLGTDIGVPADFIGTAVVSGIGGATLVAASETLNEATGVLLSYAGFEAGTNVVNTPLLFKNYNGWVSGAQVVNMAPGTITVNATIYQRNSAVTIGLGSRTLQPNESYTYYLPAISELPDDFVGSGAFTATGPISVVVQEINEGRGAGMAYSGFGGGTPNVSVPVIYKDWSAWDSGIQVQNLGSADAVVNVTYHLAGGQNVVEAVLITAGNSETFYQPANPNLTAGTIGGATLTSNGGQPIVAIVNQVNYNLTGDGSMVYEGINY
jgi:hypothetical protein